ncbi:MAG TPA: efflux RND transporter periplasmic adaptor subunit [Anaerolineales bacterium]|nr:efflux RND transporter periplasmic adaptor subunit [Anaerolineales bacterium]
MKRLNGRQLLSASLIAILLISPVSAAFASGANNAVSAQQTVTASAVIAPARVARLGFLISAIAGDIPVQEGDIVQAGQALVVLDTPDLQFAVTAAEAALRSAQSYAELQKYQKVQVRRNGKIFYETLPEEYRQRANVKVQQAQVALELAQVRLTQATLAAPFDGTIASLNIMPGEFVPSDQPIITLATLDALQVETTDLSERDIRNVRVGAPVSIFVEALEETFTGRVVTISPIADTVSGDVIFKVTIAFDSQPKGLLWGMTAEVKIAE